MKNNNKIIAILVYVMIMILLPSTLALKPAPMTVGMTPSMVIVQDNKSTNASVASPGVSATVIKTIPPPNTIPPSINTRSDAVRVEINATNDSKILHRVVSSSVSLSSPYSLRVMNRLNEKNITPGLISELPENTTKVLLYLPRAEQEKIVNMDKAEAKERLSKLRLVEVKKDLLYSARTISDERLTVSLANAVVTKSKNSELTKEVEENRDLFEKAKAKKSDELATKSAKNYLVSSAGFMINTLEGVKYNIEMSNDFSEEEANNVIAYLDKEIEAMKKARLLAEASETKDDIIEMGKLILKDWQEAKQAVVRNSLNLMEKKLEEIIKRDEQIEKKLECSLVVMEEKGIDTSKIDDMIDNFSHKVMEAKQELSMARGSLESEKVASTKTRLDEAQGILKDIVRAIKDNGGELVDCNGEGVSDQDSVLVVEGN